MSEAMGEIITGAVQSVAREAFRQPGVTSTAPVRRMSHPEYHEEEAVVGVELNTFKKRAPSEDGTYVVVTEHSEHIEKIRQPPTEAEIAQAREDRRFMTKVLAGLGAAGLLAVGFIAMGERNRQTKLDQVRYQHALSSKDEES